MRNRKEVRQRIAEDLAVELTEAQEVYSHMKGGFSGQSPVVRVMSMGSGRQRLTATAGKDELMFTIQLWVLYADKSEDYTEEMAEDMLDDLEAQVATWVYDNRTNDIWKAIDLIGFSRVDSVIFEGRPYLVEDIQVAVKCY